MLAGATAYLKLMGDTTGGWMLAKGALAASRRDTDDAHRRTKIALAHIFAESVLARVRRGPLPLPSKWAAKSWS